MGNLATFIPWHSPAYVQPTVILCFIIAFYLLNLMSLAAASRHTRLIKKAMRTIFVTLISKRQLEKKTKKLRHVFFGARKLFLNVFGLRWPRWKWMPTCKESGRCFRYFFPRVLEKMGDGLSRLVRSLKTQPILSSSWSRNNSWTNKLF